MWTADFQLVVLSSRSYTISNTLHMVQSLSIRELRTTLRKMISYGDSSNLYTQIDDIILRVDSDQGLRFQTHHINKCSHQLFQLLGKRPYTNSSSFWLEIDGTSVCVLISLSNNPMVPLLISNSKKIHSVFMLLNNRVGLVPLFNDMESSEFPRWNAIVLVFPLPCQNYRMGSFCIFVGFSLFWRDIHNNIPFWLWYPEIHLTAFKRITKK